MKTSRLVFKSTLFLVALLLGVAIAGCIRNPATKKVHTRLLSAESERRIGIEAKKKILEQYHVVKSSEVVSYVNRVGQRLANVCDRPTVDYDFTVLDHDLVNAFAVPGGFIFVTRGLLEQMNDEAELAMVLAHEIAHITALHGVQMIQKEMGQNALTILGSIGAAIVAGPEAMLMVANTANLFSELYLLGYSRDKEKEADAIGVQYLLRAGYDPQAPLRFFKTLQQSDNEKVKGWDLYFRTHPTTEERIAIMEAMIGGKKPEEEHAYREDFQKMKSHLPKVETSERGEIQGQIYVNRFHELRLSVPSNWSLGFYHPQSLISFQTLDKKGEGRLQVIELASTTANAEDLAYQFSKYAGYQLITGREVLYGAGYGFLGRYQGVTGTGRPMEIRLFATIRRKKGYILFCGAPLEEADRYRLDLEQIIRSFRFG